MNSLWGGGQGGQARASIDTPLVHGWYVPDAVFRAARAESGPGGEKSDR